MTLETNTMISFVRSGDSLLSLLVRWVHVGWYVYTTHNGCVLHSYSRSPDLRVEEIPVTDLKYARGSENRHHDALLE